MNMCKLFVIRSMENVFTELFYSNRVNLQQNHVIYGPGIQIMNFYWIIEKSETPFQGMKVY